MYKISVENAKKDPDRPFAYAFLRLTNQDDTMIKDDVWTLFLYKVYIWKLYMRSFNNLCFNTGGGWKVGTALHLPSSPLLQGRNSKDQPLL